MELLCQECAQFSFTNTYEFPSKRVQWVYNCHFSQLHHSLIFYCFNAPFNYWLCYSLSFINVLFVNLDCFFYRGFSFPYIHRNSVCFNDSVQFSRSVVSDSLRPHELQHARPPCPSPTPRVHLNSHASSQWCHPAISSSVVPFSSCSLSLPASGSFPVSQLFAWGGQSNPFLIFFPIFFLHRHRFYHWTKIFHFDIVKPSLWWFLLSSPGPQT